MDSMNREDVLSALRQAFKAVEYGRKSEESADYKRGHDAGVLSVAGWLGISSDEWKKD